MPPYQVLKKIDRLYGSRVLDLGCRDCTYSEPFAGAGYKVDAIDKYDHRQTCLAKGISVFILADIDTFKPEARYDIVIARHVLPFLKETITTNVKKLIALTNVGGVIYLTFFGDEDDFASSGKVHVMNDAFFRQLLRDLPVEILYSSTERYTGKTYTEKLKGWHIITYVLQVNRALV